MLGCTEHIEGRAGVMSQRIRWIEIAVVVLFSSSFGGGGRESADELGAAAA